MKACPYCAEMIQDAAAKCRFCGEWLDPTKRPDWAQPAATAAPAQASPPAPSAVPPAAGPAPVRPAPPRPRDLDPSATTTDGSVHRPRRRGTQTWSAPAWMAKDDARTQPAPSSPTAPSAPKPEPKPAPKAERPVPPEIDALLDSGPPAVAEPEPEPEPRPQVELLATPAPAPEPVEQTIDDVAERMKRIRASAAAVREAMLAESGEQQPSVLTGEDVEAALTVKDDDPSSEDPSPRPPPDVASMLGDDFDDFDDDDDLDPPPTPAPRKARSDADLDDLDDAMPPASGALADFDFGDDDFDDDDDDFDGDFGDVGASRPIPWKPVALGVGLVLVIGVGFSWNRLFGGETLEETPTAESGEDGEDAAPADGQVAQGSVAPAPTPSPTPGQGQPVVPEGQTPAAAVGTPADPGVDPGAAAAEPGAADPGAAAGAQPEAPAVPAAAVPPAAPVPADAMATLDEARSLYQKGGKRRLTEAKEKLQGILDAAPNSADALLLMAQVELELGEMEASLATATKCTTVAPQTADCWLSIGVLKQNAKEDEAAVAAFERYLALAPEGAYASQVKKQLARLQ